MELSTDMCHEPQTDELTKRCCLVCLYAPLFEIAANPLQSERLYETALRHAQLLPTDTVLDLFCGTGTIGLSMAAHCARVVGVEVVKEAVADAKLNAKRNGIRNATFVLGDLDRVKDVPIEAIGAAAASVIIVDPPRGGLHKNLVKFLAKTTARRIVYVSCNPATQVQDMAYLLEIAPKGKFVLEEATPVDMFPHTSHCECVLSIAVNQVEEEERMNRDEEVVAELAIGKTDRGLE
jgi:23S rRNA (uracil1939-C5)-methyltransferase